MNKEEAIELAGRKHQEFLSKLSSSERKQYLEDSAEKEAKLKHCIEDGISISNNIKIEEFIYLKDLKPEEHVNEILIRSLAFHSGQNIILRYLLIEAALNNEKIESILKEIKISGTKFYSIPNNLEEFNNKQQGFIEEKYRLSPHTLQNLLFVHGIAVPSIVSKIKITAKIELIMQERIALFIEKLSGTLDKEINEILFLRKKIMPITDFYKSIEFGLRYFFNPLIESQFKQKNRNYNQSFILYLNEMYWLDKKSLGSIIDAYLYLPSFLLGIANNEKVLFESSFPFFEHKIKIRKLSKNNPVHELFIYAHFKYYLKNKRTSISSDKHKIYYGSFYLDKLDRKKYNQIHSLVDANNELGVFSFKENENSYAKFEGNLHQQFRSWIKDNKNNPNFKEFSSNFHPF